MRNVGESVGGNELRSDPDHSAQVFILVTVVGSRKDSQNGHLLAFLDFLVFVASKLHLVASNHRLQLVVLEEMECLLSGVEIGARTGGVEGPFFFIFFDGVAPQQVTQHALLRDLHESIHFLKLIYIRSFLPKTWSYGEIPACTQKYFESTMQLMGSTSNSRATI